MVDRDGVQGRLPLITVVQRPADVPRRCNSRSGAFFEPLRPSVVDPGQPVSERTTTGEAGTSAKLGGYSVIHAEDLQARSRWPRNARP
jgi:hypothetical protein